MIPASLNTGSLTFVVLDPGQGCAGCTWAEQWFSPKGQNQ
jgi:hypothetical protein